jgi:hypothetical protein
MSQNPHARHFGPVLRPHDIQMIHAQQHIKKLQEVLQAVRDDLRERAKIGTYDGDHYYQLGNSVLERLCEVTE